MANNKHIGMWACPRSRSTVMTRAFERLDGCIIYDEPFLGPYIWTRKENFRWENATQKIYEIEKDHKKVIEKITGDLPSGKKFSYQKLSTDEYLPEFGTEWIPQLTNFFLIRHPKDILLSLHTAIENQSRGFFKKEITEEFVGIKALHYVFQALHSMTGKTPLVISSDDVVKNPHRTLQWLCGFLEIEFDEKMLTWDTGLKDSSLSTSVSSSETDADPWYKTLRSSQTFLPYKKKESSLPDHLIPMLNKCMPYYEELLKHRHIFSD